MMRTVGKESNTIAVKFDLPRDAPPPKEKETGSFSFFAISLVLLTDFNNLSPLEPEMEKGSEAMQKL